MARLEIAREAERLTANVETLEFSMSGIVSRFL